MSHSVYPPPLTPSYPLLQYHYDIGECSGEEYLIDANNPNVKVLPESLGVSPLQSSDVYAQLPSTNYIIVQILGYNVEVMISWDKS
jgi:hypothetical protein